MQQVSTRPNLVDLPIDAVDHRPHSMTRRPLYVAAKRLFDICFATVLLILAAPLWLLVAIAIRVTSPGPVIYRQSRAGRGGRVFTCYKFRTMVDSADEQKALLQGLNEMSGPVFKIRADPRVTPAGRWLRRTSIDELPQLLNVLKGDMSVVGPRPLPVTEAEALAMPHQQRHLVKPGLTCLWQVSGRSDVDFEQWMDLDIEYIRRRGFWFDMLLVLRTIVVVVTMRGAA